jgi:hypothetical protein
VRRSKSSVADSSHRSDVLSDIPIILRSTSELKDSAGRSVKVDKFGDSSSIRTKQSRSIRSSGVNTPQLEQNHANVKDQTRSKSPVNTSGLGMLVDDLIANTEKSVVKTSKVLKSPVHDRVSTSTSGKKSPLKKKGKSESIIDSPKQAGSVIKSSRGDGHDESKDPPILTSESQSIQKRSTDFTKDDVKNKNRHRRTSSNREYEPFVNESDHLSMRTKSKKSRATAKEEVPAAHGESP